MAFYGFCNIALITLRKQASHRSGMVSQLLFGEAYEIMEYENDWLLIRTHFDQYEGYMNRNQLSLIREKNIFDIIKSKTPLFLKKTPHYLTKEETFLFKSRPEQVFPLAIINA